MGHRHTREEILEGAVATAFDDGLALLSFGRVAKRLGISDRTVVYYFPSKDDLVTGVLAVLGAQIQDVLATAFTSPADDHRRLAASAWPVLAQPEIDPVFGLYFEASGLAAVGRQPFAALARQLAEGWITWLAQFFTGSPAHRRAEAEAGLALIDGLLLLRQLAGPESAQRAAARMGVV